MVRYLTLPASPLPVTNPGLTADAWDGLGAVAADSESEQVKDVAMEVEDELGDKEGGSF